MDRRETKGFPAGMGLYGRYLLPHIIDLVMRDARATEERERFVPLASGTVLEVGMGSGLNLPFYGSDVHRLYGLDPSPELQEMARRRAASVSLPIEFMESSAEDIPLDDGAVDTVVTTWTLCSIPDAVAAIREMRRVLKPAGRLIFVEHGRAPEARIAAWQDRITPFWKPIAGGCHLNRPIDRMLTQGGFRAERLETGYLKGPKPWTFTFKGLARIA